MTLTITDDAMTSDVTEHYAGRADLPGLEVWLVSWLPGASLTRNQAITAMTLAEMVASGIGDHTDKRWPHIDGWAAELGLSGPDAVGKISDLGAELGADDGYQRDESNAEWLKSNAADCQAAGGCNHQPLA